MKKLSPISKNQIQEYIVSKKKDVKDILVTNTIYIFFGRIFGTVGAITIDNGSRVVYIHSKNVRKWLSENNPDCANYSRKDITKELIKNVISHKNSHVLETISSSKYIPKTAKNDYTEKQESKNARVSEDQQDLDDIEAENNSEKTPQQFLMDKKDYLISIKNSSHPEKKAFPLKKIYKKSSFKYQKRKNTALLRFHEIACNKQSSRTSKYNLYSQNRTRNITNHPIPIVQKSPKLETGYDHVYMAKEEERKAIYTAIYNEAKSPRYESFIQSLQKGETINLYPSLKNQTDNDFYIVDSAETTTTNGKNRHNFYRTIQSNRYTLSVLRKLANHGRVITQQLIEEIKNYIDENNYPLNDENLKQYIIQAKNEPSRVSSILEKEYQTLCDKIVVLHNTILKNDSSENVSDKNMKILQLLRECHSMQAYQYLRLDESIPAIQYLHGIVLASYIDVQQMPYFEKLISNFTEIKSENISDTISEGHKNAIAQGIFYNDANLEYMLQFPTQRIGAFASISLGQKIMKYDPRGALENTPGKLRSFIDKKGNESHLIYTSSPTIGNEIAPEMKIALQAIENRRILKIKENSLDISYPNLIHWHYSNLQNISSDEGGRSRAIMNLNIEFPLSFSAVTLSHDSPFYVDGIHAKLPEKVIEEMLKRQTLSDQNKPTILNEEYKKRCIEEILCESNYKLERSKNSTGYYFPIASHNKEAVALWEATANNIIEKAYEQTYALKKSEFQAPSFRQYSEEEQDKIFQWEQKAAFRELVTIGIARYFGEKARDTLPEKSSILMNFSCKECIDRGGKLTALFAYCSIENEKEATQVAHSGVFSRAILARYRVILAHRIQPFLSLTRLFSHKSLHTFFQETIPQAIQETSQKMNSESYSRVDERIFHRIFHTN